MRLLFLVEGQTEAAFVKRVLEQHFLDLGFEQVTPTIITTNVNPTGKNMRGGHTSVEKMSREAKALLQSGAYVTTLFDYYGCKWFPRGLPISDALQHLHSTVDNNSHFIPYLQQYEFEALLFSEPGMIADELNPRIKSELLSIVEHMEPEEINDSPQTAPSKRLETLIPSYNKVLQGPRIAERIGLQVIRKKCPRFDCWISSLEALATTPNV